MGKSDIYVCIGVFLFHTIHIFPRMIIFKTGYFRDNILVKVSPVTYFLIIFILKYLDNIDSDSCVRWVLT